MLSTEVGEGFRGVHGCFGVAAIQFQSHLE